MKIIVNGVEQNTPCKKVKLADHKSPKEIKALVQNKQKEIKQEDLAASQEAEESLIGE